MNIYFSSSEQSVNKVSYFDLLLTVCQATVFLIQQQFINILIDTYENLMVKPVKLISEMFVDWPFIKGVQMI
jgi:hypothetical protein